MRLGKFEGGIEAVDRLHQIEGRAERLSLVTRRDQRRVRNISARERRENARFPTHCFVAVLAFVGRGTAEHEVPAAASEPQQDVLGSARDRFDIEKRTRLEPARVHPAGERAEVNESVEVSHRRGDQSSAVYRTPVNSSEMVQSRRAVSRSFDRFVESTRFA